jgi:hypothetical protein
VAVRSLVWGIVAANVCALLVGGALIAVIVLTDKGRSTAVTLRGSVKPGMSYRDVEALARRRETYSDCEGVGPTPCASHKLRVSTKGNFGVRWDFIVDFGPENKVSSVSRVWIEGDSGPW